MGTKTKHLLSVKFPRTLLSSLWVNDRMSPTPASFWWSANPEGLRLGFAGSDDKQHHLASYAKLKP